jgi:hypothetical protein
MEGLHLKFSWERAILLRMKVKMWCNLLLLWKSTLLLKRRCSSSKSLRRFYFSKNLSIKKLKALTNLFGIRVQWVVLTERKMKTSSHGKQVSSQALLQQYSWFSPLKMMRYYLCRRINNIIIKTISILMTKNQLQVFFHWISIQLMI